MEWSDIYESAHEENNARIFSSLTPPPVPEWSFEENEVFENAVAMFGLGTKLFYDNIVQMLPGKSIEDIRKKGMSLIKQEVPRKSTADDHDPMPNNGKQQVIEVDDDDEGDGQAHDQDVTVKKGKKKRGVPWTELEHQVFLVGLNKYGKGDWRSISRYTPLRKSATQIASHAQKYFRRKTSTTPVERRRPSIHDIQTVKFSDHLFNLIPTSPPTIDLTTTMMNDMTINCAAPVPTFNHNNDMITTANVDANARDAMDMNMNHPQFGMPYNPFANFPNYY